MEREPNHETPLLFWLRKSFASPPSLLYEELNPATAQKLNLPLHLILLLISVGLASSLLLSVGFIMIHKNSNTTQDPHHHHEKENNNTVILISFGASLVCSMHQEILNIGPSLLFRFQMDTDRNIWIATQTKHPLCIV